MLQEREANGRVSTAKGGGYRVSDPPASATLGKVFLENEVVPSD